MRNARQWLVALCLLGCPHKAAAQLLPTLFPEGVPGYGSEQGVTVQSRARPGYDPLGIHIDTIVIQPRWDTATGYDDNVFAGATHLGAWEFVNRPSLLISKNDPNGSAAFYVSANDVRYIGETSQDRTDGSACTRPHDQLRPRRPDFGRGLRGAA